MDKIEGAPKNLKSLLLNTKYIIHYYQREYRWKQKHIEELIDDLTSEFLQYYQEGDSRKKVEHYGAYFMGSIVLSGKDKAIIDGQQRLTSITLLLIYLNHRLKDYSEEHSSIEPMIFSETYGNKSFNIDVEERANCMQAIFKNEFFDDSDAPESVKNLCDRYADIVDVFPEEINQDNILHFCDWLIEKVYFIEIDTAVEQDAHKIFVTMNDRGLSLSPTEMLKGYLLSNIDDDAKREKLNQMWKEKVMLLRTIDDKEDDVFIKTWLRAQYAETIRENKKDAENRDFEIVGNAFHKWVREEHSRLHLNNSDDFEDFINRFAKFVDVYVMIKKAGSEFSENTKYIYYNAQLNFTWQPQMLLASLSSDDPKETMFEKMNLVARYIDLLIVSRVIKYKSVDYNTIKYSMFQITKSIRCMDVSALKQVLFNHFQNLDYNPAEWLDDFRLNNYTKKYIKHMLARITGFIEDESGIVSNYSKYIDYRLKNPYEIEHIIANHYELADSNEYVDKVDFDRWRNNFGALLLLRKDINASLNDSDYNFKLKKYCSLEGNIYTSSLSVGAYQNNPGFLKFIERYALDFKPYDKFGKKEIEGRIRVLVQLMNLVWNGDMFRG